MAEDIKLTDYEIDTIANLLPKYPPLTIGGGDASIKDMHPTLSPDELDKIFEIYKRNGGTMRKE